MRRSVAFLLIAPALASVLLTASPAGAGTSSVVKIIDFGYKPNAAKVALGGDVTWTNTGQTRHSATSDGIDPCCQHGVGLWASGGMDNGQSFSFAFVAAGTYTYHCTEHTFMTAKITVAPTATPPTGGVGTTFTTTWAKGAIPKGYNVDVQVKTPNGDWADWKTDRTGSHTSGKYKAKAGPGTYQFRARLQNGDTGGVSGWSPAASVKVS